VNLSQRDSLARPDISAWNPLRQPVFRALCIASLTSNVGTWMQNLGAVPDDFSHAVAQKRAGVVTLGDNSTSVC
jgi:hypothetical protein